MGAVAKLVMDPPLREFETVIDNWGSTVFLIKGKDRYGNLAYSLRMVIGELRPWRFGPYRSKREAFRFMTKLTTALDECTCNIPGDAMSAGLRYAANEEW